MKSSKLRLLGTFTAISMRNGPYELVKAPPEYPGKKYRNKYVYEHHLVFWIYTGKLIPNNFVLHHKNENKRDNSFKNLELLKRADHSKTHSKKTLLIEFSCGWCGNLKSLPKRVLNNRLKFRTVLFCSLRCGALNQHHKNKEFRGSSTVERSAVSRSVGGSSPSPGANFYDEPVG